MNWTTESVLATGGASFIGSHRIDARVDRRAALRGADDLPSRKDMSTRMRRTPNRSAAGGRLHRRHFRSSGYSHCIVPVATSELGHASSQSSSAVGTSDGGLGTPAGTGES